MTSNIDATIRAALLLNANHLLQAAVSNLVCGGPRALSNGFEQSAETFKWLHLEYNEDDAWRDWPAGKWEQVLTALRMMSRTEAAAYHREDAMARIERHIDQMPVD